MTPQASAFAAGRAVRKVIEWSAHEGLAGVVERHNFHFQGGTNSPDE